MKIGIYPGSFNPYHVGHHNIYLRSKQIFDKVFVARGQNPDKPKPEYKIPENILQIEYEGSLINGIKKVYDLNKGVCSTDEIIVIRGFRNLKDIEYQQEQDYWLKQELPTFKSIYIECEEQYKHISSSAIKELKRLNLKHKHLLI